MIFGRLDWPWYVLWFAKACGVCSAALERVQLQGRSLRKRWQVHRRRAWRSRARRRRARREARK